MAVEHAKLNRRVLEYVPLMETAFCKLRGLVDSS